jgi:SPP1 family predicted phage head-tail adaptor
MRAGSLRKRVTLYDLTLGRDAIGGTVETWGNARDRWASADPLSAREYIAAQGIGEARQVKFMLRYDSTFSMTSKIVWGGVDYHVDQLRDIDSRNRTLEVVATRRSPT